ncbi:hypothetical protein [Methylophilus sp. 3sh_L]|uniref:hypothetical protein n=1 Tax=Methylophilus sp. 3sh_L TaxID=3377114 RepID=UPI00398F66DA
MIEPLYHYFVHNTAYPVNGMPKKNFRTPFNSLNVSDFPGVVTRIFAGHPAAPADLWCRFMVRFSLVRNTDI